ncbi:septum formation inhibitor Maf [Winogradskyella sp. DF17]|uniref:Septum formation inhibitor Maf n=1 Tax=Winogradskyella pelagia TaxID=2819984 RepID=A0ABS3T472_9FLAO|nr:septum formation inhibitor Maf [Winogradskyella sp. DF17]MBO3116545.1 septum formation inhibitor Maf [Winogradskyella sp. DF17]
MKKNNALKPIILFLILLALLMTSFSCKEGQNSLLSLHASTKDLNEKTSYKPKLTKAFKAYWYNGEAEISSYKLEQARYGEIRNGHAVLVFVTEDFLPDTQVKADTYSDDNIPVLKLNATKNFNTGIYPYSIMQSTFYPVVNTGHALKISTSIQEWCGQVYAQLNNRKAFEIKSHSYFQGEADKSYELEKTWTENELWTKLRIDPNSLPTGNLQIIPSLEFTRLKHKRIKSYEANAQLSEGLYSVNYPNLNRSLKINFSSEFPYEILGWEETMVSGYGANSEVLTTKATKLKTMKSAYWTKNKNKNLVLRDSLQLK